MSHLVSLIRRLQTLKHGYIICKRITLPRLPVSATCGKFLGDTHCTDLSMSPCIILQLFFFITSIHLFARRCSSAVGSVPVCLQGT